MHQQHPIRVEDVEEDQGGAKSLSLSILHHFAFFPDLSDAQTSPWEILKAFGRSSMVDAPLQDLTWSCISTTGLLKEGSISADLFECGL